MNKETEQLIAELERIVAERQDWLFRFAYMRINHGDDSFPFEWKTLKSMVNGEKVYYKEPL